MSTGEIPRSDNVVWDSAAVDRAERWQTAGQPGLTIWITGLPAAGKSTLAKALEAHLVRGGRLAYRLDGDNLRHGLCGDLEFGAEDREENVRRTAAVAQLMADAGVIVIVALVSPYRASRARARALHEAARLGFLEVFADTPLDICEARDPKGLYARARAGDLVGMSGIDDPYEPPAQPDVHLSHPWEIGDAVTAILRRIVT